VYADFPERTPAARGMETRWRFEALPQTFDGQECIVEFMDADRNLSWLIQRIL
jgi:hypothetical protein